MKLYTDGAGAAKAGRPGGWAFVLVEDDELLLEGCGRDAVTTSLLMELRAAQRGLEAAFSLGVAEVQLITDCRIVLDVLGKSFLPKPAPVRAAAQALVESSQGLSLTTRWVRAHAGEPWNEAVDALAAWARDDSPGPPS